MSNPDVVALTAQVLWASFFLALAFGAIAQRTHFCTMGAVSDWVNMGDLTRMRQWGMAAGVAMLGFAALSATGLIDPSRALYHSNRWIWLSAAVGGLLFGFGMVLASGCGSKTLVRVGSGNLKSLVVFVVLGVSSYATLRGITAVLRNATVDRVALDMQPSAGLPQWLAGLTGADPSTTAWVVALILGGGLVMWALWGRGFRTAENLLAGLGIGATVVGMWWVSGHLGYLPEHPETLEAANLGTQSGRMEAFTFVAPIAHSLDWLMFFSDKSKVLTLGVVVVVGVVIGSFLTSIMTRTFRWEGFGSTEDLGNHLVGAVLMGVGGVTAMGCTVGQGLSGVSTLSLTSFVAVAGIIGGGFVALKYQMWRLERQA